MTCKATWRLTRHFVSRWCDILRTLSRRSASKVSCSLILMASGSLGRHNACRRAARGSIAAKPSSSTSGRRAIPSPYHFVSIRASLAVMNAAEECLGCYCQCDRGDPILRPWRLRQAAVVCPSKSGLAEKCERNLSRCSRSFSLRIRLYPEEPACVTYGWHCRTESLMRWWQSPQEAEGMWEMSSKQLCLLFELFPSDNPSSNHDPSLTVRFGHSSCRRKPRSIKVSHGTPGLEEAVVPATQYSRIGGHRQRFHIVNKNRSRCAFLRSLSGGISYR